MSEFSVWNLDRLCCHIVGSYHMDTNDAEEIANHLHSQEQPQTDCISPSQSQFNGFSWGSIRNWERFITGNNMFKQLELHFNRGSPLTVFRQFEKNSHQVFSTRNWLVQLWLEEGISQSSRLTKILIVSQNVEKKEFALKNHLLLFSLSSIWFGSSTVAKERSDGSEKSFIQQPSPRQSCENIFQPTSPEEVSSISISYPQSDCTQSFYIPYLPPSPE